MADEHTIERVFDKLDAMATVGAANNAKLDRCIQDVAGVSTKLDVLNTNGCARGGPVHNDHEQRIRKLESRSTEPRHPSATTRNVGFVGRLLHDEGHHLTRMAVAFGTAIGAAIISMLMGFANARRFEMAQDQRLRMEGIMAQRQYDDNARLTKQTALITQIVSNVVATTTRDLLRDAGRP